MIQKKLRSTFLNFVALCATTLTLVSCSGELRFLSIGSFKAALLELSVSKVDFGTKPYGSLNTAVVEIKNVGGMPAAFRSISDVGGFFSYLGLASPTTGRYVPGTFPGVGGTCPTEGLAPGATCKMVVAFRPSFDRNLDSSAPIKARWSATYASDGLVEEPQAVAMELMGTMSSQAVLAFSTDGVQAVTDAPIELGTVALGYPIEIPFQVLFWGYQPATEVTFVPSSDGFFFETINCPTTSISSNCRVTLGYRPQRAGRIVSKPIRIAYNNGASGASTTVRLAFEVSDQVVPARIASSRPQFDFAERALGSSTTLSTILMRQGTLAATGVSLSLQSGEASSPFSITGSSCGAVMSSQCEVQVTYSPSTSGTDQAVLQVRYFDGQKSQSLEVPVRGSGKTRAQLAIEATDGRGGEFSRLSSGEIERRVFSVKNTAAAGSFAASALSLSTTQTGIEIESMNCPTNLAPGANCSVTVRFAPVLDATAGGVPRDVRFESSLEATYGDGLGQRSASLPLFGTATKRAKLVLTPPTIDFGSILVGNSREIEVPIAYFGIEAASITAVRGTSSTFGVRFAATPPTYPNYQASTSVFVRFSPTSVGAMGPVQIEIEYRDSLVNPLTHQLHLTARGTGGEPAHLTVSRSALDFGSRSLRNFVDESFTVTNAGGVEASDIGIVGLASPFSLAASCPRTLAPGASCVVRSRFNPLVAGRASILPSIEYQSGAGVRSVPLDWTGMGLDRVRLKFRLAELDLGTVIVGQTKTVFLEVDRFGSETATAVGTSGLGSPWTNGSTSPPGALLPVCGASIADACGIPVSFQPTQSGAAQTSVALTYLAGDLTPGESTTILLKANAIEPGRLVASPSALNFAPTPVGKASVIWLTLTNVGQASATIDSLEALVAPFSYSGASACLGKTLSQGQSCGFPFQFLPTSSGNQQAATSVNYGNGIAPTSLGLALTGVGLAESSLEFQPIALDFGTRIVGSTTPLTVDLVAYGLGSVPIVGSGIVVSPGFEITGSSCANPIVPSLSIPRSAACQLQVSFKPQTAGPLSGSLEIEYSPGVALPSRKVVLSLSGIAKPAARLVLVDPAAAPIDFGTLSWKDSREITLTFKNDATNEAAAAAISAFTGLVSPFGATGGSCLSTASLAPGATCLLKVRFAPVSPQMDDQNATLDIAYFDGALVRHATTALTGRSTDAAELRFLEQSRDAGGVVVGTQSAPMVLHLKYFGGLPSEFIEIIVDSPLFTVTSDGTCPAVGVPLAQDCEMRVVFRPTAAGAQSANLTVNYLDGKGGSRIARAVRLSGTGRSAARLVMTPTNVDFGTIRVGTTAARTITVGKTGDGAATLASAPSLGLPFRYQGGSYPGTGGTCSLTIQSSCSIVIEFAPTSGGPAQVTYSIIYSDGIANQQATAQLNATGVATASVNVVLFEGNFSRTKVGETRTGKVRVTNAGSAPATSLSATLPLYFRSVGTALPGTLAAGAEAILELAFTPTAPARTIDSLVVSFHDGWENKQVSRDLLASAEVPASVSANGDNSCAVTRFGAVKCWGRNDRGQLGLGHTSPRINAMRENDIESVNLGNDFVASSISVGFNHTCALSVTGQLKCWGRNDSGQLGLGDVLDRGASSDEMGSFLPKVDLGTGRRAIAVSAGYGYTCALLENGEVKCWGRNHRGQLGLGDARTRGDEPAEMGTSLASVNLGTILAGGNPRAVKAVEISTSAGHTCALLETGGVKCWGDNLFGQLGQGDVRTRGLAASDMGDALLPVALGDGRRATGVSAGGGFTCATRDDGSVVCWGKNNEGSVVSDNIGNLGTGNWCQSWQGGMLAGPCDASEFPLVLFGYGTTVRQMGNYLPAVNLGVGRTARKVAAGQSHVCAVLDDASVKCWGANDFGQLGQGDDAKRGVDLAGMGDALSAVDWGAPLGALSIHGAGNHACVVVDGEKIKCWGYNGSGNLGVGDTDARGDESGEMGTGLPWLLAE